MVAIYRQCNVNDIFAKITFIYNINLKITMSNFLSINMFNLYKYSVHTTVNERLEKTQFC